MRLYVKKLHPSELDHEMVFTLTALCCLLLLLFYRVYPGALPWIPQCAFRHILGISCLTCGLSRSAQSLADFRLLDALRFHPLGAALMLAAGAWLAYGLCARVLDLRRVRVSLEQREKTRLRIAAVIAILLNWAYLIAVGI